MKEMAERLRAMTDDRDTYLALYLALGQQRESMIAELDYYKKELDYYKKAYL